MAVGVGYDFQLLSSMTFEDEYDVPLDGVITDKREVFIDECLEKICADAYEARVKIGTLDTDIKNKVLNDAADNLLKAEKEILEANKRDVATAEENMKAKSMIDRLSLDHDRLLGMADGLRQIAKLADPIGEVCLWQSVLMALLSEKEELQSVLLALSLRRAQMSLRCLWSVL